MKNTLIVFLLFSVTGYGQEFRPLHLVSDSNLIKTMVGKRVTYTYHSYTIEGAGKVLKVRQNKKMVLTDEGEEGLKRIVPHIFLSNDSADHPVMMTDLSSDALYGFNLYILNGLESVKIGFIPIAALALDSEVNMKEIPPVSIVDRLLLETNGIMMRISFTQGQLMLRPGTSKEDIVDANQVKFLFNGKKLKEVDEF